MLPPGQGVIGTLVHKWPISVKLGGGHGHEDDDIFIVAARPIWRNTRCAVNAAGPLRCKDSGFWKVVAVLGLTLLGGGGSRASRAFARTRGRKFAVATDGVVQRSSGGSWFRWR